MTGGESGAAVAAGRLTGQRIVVLGGGSGIGRAAALGYLAEGADVTVVERSAEHARTAFQDTGHGPTTVVGDATDPEVIERAIGGGPLDNLTCCVGLFDQFASLRDMAPARLQELAQEIWRANVASVLNAAVVGWPHLKASSGSLTVTLSESAYHAVGGGVLYGSAKWALRGVVTHLASDFAPEARVNGVAPGGTSGTGFSAGSRGGAYRVDQSERDERIARGTLLGRVAVPDDHAGAYVYLADRAAARVVTGIVVNTDGGRAYGAG